MDLGPDDSLEPLLKLVPGKWCVYLLTDANDQPVQLLCVKNLRASLERRLGPGEVAVGPSRKVNYREIVRRIYWRRVDSAFETDAVYLEAARKIFPDTYRGMVGFRPAWFVHVNPKTNHPRYTRTIDPTGKTGTYFGPVEDKHAAQKLVHVMEGLFDLCRDYSILVQSPAGGPCPWKQMDKCVGPCDGTISLDAYGELVAFSAAALADPKRYAEHESLRMQQAAGDMQFELAAKIKERVEQVQWLWKGPNRHVRSLHEFRFISLQRGPRSGTARVFLITPGGIDEIADLIVEPDKPADLLRLALHLADQRSNLPLDEAGVERIGVVAHSLFQAKAGHGVFLRLSEIDERSFTKAYRDLQKQKASPESEGEGVMKELQAL